jgi:HK97 family phage major capsid protein
VDTIARPWMVAGYHPDGRPIYRMMGGEAPTGTAAELGQKADATFAELQTLMGELREAKDGEKDRFDNLSAKADLLGTQVAELKQAQADAEAKEAQSARMDELQARMDELAKNQHAPSKARAILSGKSDDIDVDVDSFFRTLVLATNPKAPISLRQQAEKALLDMGSEWRGIPDVSKAILGDTDAAGGYLAPRAIIGELTQVAAANNPYRSLLTVVPNVLGPTIDVPHIGLAPTRASVVGRGQTKDNVNVSLANYTATMYTLAQIIDAGNQWLRQTKGRGEQIIRERLGKAIGLGEMYYILNGTGTNEPYGLLTALGTSGTFVTSHTASNSTVAGAAATAIAKAAGDLAGRSRTPDGVVMNAKDFWIMLAQGSDTAGFWVAPAAGPTSVNVAGFQNGSPALRVWNTNLGIYPDPTMPADSLVVGEFKGAELYIGEDFRLDTSSEAGDRWDKNLTGFRAEEEMGFDARPYVAAGLFQRVVDAVA